MTAKSLIGIIPASAAAHIPALLVDKKPHVVSHGSLAAVTLPAVGQSRLSTAKRSLTARLSQLQIGLETLTRSGPVLGAALDQHFDTDEDLQRFLEGNEVALNNAMTAYGACWQFQIDISWKTEAVLSDLAGRGAIQAAGGTDKDLASAMQTALAMERVRLALAMNAILQPVATELATLPLAGEEEVARYLVLIKRDEEATLDAAVEAVDALAPDLFQIKYRGPLPATSFACVARNFTTSDDLKDAAQIIGLPSGEAAGADIQSAFRAHCKAAHPDGQTQQDHGEIDLQAAKQARDLLICATQMRAALADDQTDAALPLLDLRRDANLQAVAEAS